MTCSYKCSLMSIGVVVFLFVAGCQTAQQRQANELRDFLRVEIENLEPLNQQVLNEKQKLYEIDSTSPWADVEKTREEYEREIIDLRKKIEDYPDLELNALSQDVRTLLVKRQQDVEWMASQNRRAQNRAKAKAAIAASAERRRQANRPWIPGMPKRDSQ